MSDLQSAVKQLRKLCADFNIYTLSCLEAVVNMGDDSTQQAIADRVSQSKSGIGQWVMWMEMNGVIEVHHSSGEKRRHRTYTALGEGLINKLTQLLCPNPTPKQSTTTRKTPLSTPRTASG